MTTFLIYALIITGAGTLIAGDHLLSSDHPFASAKWLRAHPWALGTIAAFVLLLATWTFWRI